MLPGYNHGQANSSMKGKDVLFYFFFLKSLSCFLFFADKLWP